MTRPFAKSTDKVDGGNAGLDWLGRLVEVRPGEAPALLAAFLMFFMLLAAYYVVRPVRDAMGAEVGPDQLQVLFSAVFFVMLAAAPAYGFVVSRAFRSRILPILFAFFVINLIGFWFAFRWFGTTATTAGAFFIWASVFNLFVVSLFWSLMTELWSADEATRLFGFIAAGGSAGAAVGPILTQTLASRVGTINLLLISAAFLGCALLAGLAFRRLRGERPDGVIEPVGGSLVDGALQIARSPYLARIAIFVFLANIVGTFFYLEQSRLVATAITDSAERVTFFARRDLVVSVATIVIQIFGTAHIIRRLGLGVALGALPASALAGIVALMIEPSLWVVASVMVMERIIAFALANPAMKASYTLVGFDEKYKAQNFIDTVIYRGGDAASGWIFGLIGRGAGFSIMATPIAALSLAAVWLWNAKRLSAAYDARALAADDRP